MKTHETPKPNRPSPYAKPSAAARRGVDAPFHRHEEHAERSERRRRHPERREAEHSDGPSTKAKAGRGRARASWSAASSREAGVGNAVGTTRYPSGTGVGGTRSTCSVRSRRLSARSTRKRKLADQGGFTPLGQAAEGGQHEAADGVELVVGKIGAELLVEVGDLRLRLHAEPAVGLGDDVVGAVVEVEFVLDVAHDLLQHVLDRHKPRYAAVLVHDDRDVIAIGAELAQQHVHALALGHEHRRRATSCAGRRSPGSRSRRGGPSRAGCPPRRPCSHRSRESGSGASAPRRA